MGPAVLNTQKAERVHHWSDLCNRPVSRARWARDLLACHIPLPPHEDGGGGGGGVIASQQGTTQMMGERQTARGTQTSAPLGAVGGQGAILPSSAVPFTDGFLPAQLASTSWLGSQQRCASSPSSPHKQRYSFYRYHGLCRLYWPHVHPRYLNAVAQTQKLMLHQLQNKK